MGKFSGCTRRLAAPSLLLIDELQGTAGALTAPGLTALIEQALREVTLNFATHEDAVRAVQVARALSAIAGTPRRPTGSPGARPGCA